MYFRCWPRQNLLIGSDLVIFKILSLVNLNLQSISSSAFSVGSDWLERLERLDRLERLARDRVRLLDGGTFSLSKQGFRERVAELFSSWPFLQRIPRTTRRGNFIVMLFGSSRLTIQACLLSHITFTGRRAIPRGPRPIDVVNDYIDRLTHIF